NDYGGITWLNGRGNNLAAEVLNFFISHFKLEIPQQQGDKLLTLQEQVAWCWLQYPHAEKPILIICDDVTELAQLQENVPNDNRFRVLITTRTQNLDPNYIQSIRLEIFPENQALELLQKSLGNQDNRISRNLETAKEICKSLEYLPLGIIFVAGYLLNDPGLSLAEMLAELQQRKLAAASLQDRENINQTQLGVKAAFDLTWEKLDIQSQQLAAFLSLFSPQLIVWELVVYCLNFSGENEEQRLTWSEAELNTAKIQLYQRSLLQLVTETETAEAYKIHNLVRWFLQEKLTASGEMQPVLERTFITPIIYLASQLPQSPTSEDIENFRYVVDHWEDLGKRLLAEIQENTTPQTNLPASILANEIIGVFVGAGTFYEGQGLYQLVEVQYQSCLEIHQTLFTGDHPNVATSLNNLALLYNNQGKYTEAEPLYIQALEMRQRLFTGDHPDVAQSLNNLAFLYNSQGKYTEAEPLYIQALEMFERVLGVNHPSTVTVRENLRLLRQQQQPASLSVFQRLLVVLILPFYLFWLLIKPIVKFFWRWLRR
ncbi:MAG: tetratricopeptide repeat protein, partial [Dolichospermum sp.]